MQCSFRLRASFGAAASLVLVLIALSPALARDNSSAAFSTLGTHTAFSAITAKGTSKAFGGWVFARKGATSVVSKFKLPSLKCTSRLRGVGPGTFMVTGTSKAPKQNVAGVVMDCSGGTPAAQAVATVDGATTRSPHALFVGDLMKGTVTTSATKTTATIQDLTAGHKFKLTKTGAGAASLKEALIDDALITSTHKQVPVANFGTIRFTAGKVGGKPLGSVKLRKAFNMETSTHILEILTGGLTGKTKKDFTTTWKHS